MDARRLGVGDSIPLTFLEDATAAYLTDGEWVSIHGVLSDTPMAPGV